MQEKNPELAALAKSLNLEEKVHFTDFIAEKDKPILYQLSEVLVYPSFYEGFGLPIIEAQAAGVPVVTSNVTSMPEAAGGAALLIDPHDTKGISKAIERILQDKALRESLIKNGYANAQKI